MKLDILDILKRDDMQQQEESKTQNKEKAGQLRAGNAGILMEDGNFAGSCPRRAFLRLKELDVEVDENRLVMFEFGRQNETIVIDKLRRQLGDSVVVTGDDVNKIAWTTDSGRTVSGRPDIIISDKTGKPLLVLEMKMIASLWTAKDVVFNNSPKLAHIIQAAHYGYTVGAPIKLVYIQPVDFQTPMWGNTVEQFPKPGEPLSELIEYTEKDVSQGRGKDAKKTRVMMPKKLLPSRTVYDVVVEEDGSVKYRKEGAKGGYSKTCVKMQDIESFYNAVEAMETGPLGPRPVALNADGGFGSYTPCDYCELKGLCDKYEKQPTVWLKEIAAAINNGTLKKN